MLLNESPRFPDVNGLGAIALYDDALSVLVYP
jgi:hypothetical protein